MQEVVWGKNQLSLKTDSLDSEAEMPYLNFPRYDSRFEMKHRYEKGSSSSSFQSANDSFRPRLLTNECIKLFCSDS